jgi:hypothetical protein
MSARPVRSLEEHAFLELQWLQHSMLASSFSLPIHRGLFRFKVAAAAVATTTTLSESDEAPGLHRRMDLRFTDRDGCGGRHARQPP